MKAHGNAALGPAGRLALAQAIESRMTQKAAEERARREGEARMWAPFLVEVERLVTA